MIITLARNVKCADVGVGVKALPPGVRQSHLLLDTVLPVHFGTGD